jgi:hypothetical protein
MKTQTLLVAIGVVLAGYPQQTPAPDTEIFLARVTIQGDKVALDAPVNISNNVGYDNQPFFTPDGRAILFTSVRGNRPAPAAGSAQTGSDIYRYDIDAQRVVQVTDTPESEYSPTVTPDGKHFSVIRVEADGTQRLWRFTMDGKEPELVLRDVKPVGYHAWANARIVVLFVLGQPSTLQVADTAGGKADVAAKDIGRSIQRMPTGAISFVQRERETGPDAKASPLTVSELDPATRLVKPLIRVPAGASDVDTAWLPNGTLLVSFQGKLLGWRRGDAEFKPLADLEALGLKGASRLAVSPKGDRLAIVAHRP